MLSLMITGPVSDLYVNDKNLYLQYTKFKYQRYAKILRYKICR